MVTPAPIRKVAATGAGFWSITRVIALTARASPGGRVARSVIFPKHRRLLPLPQAASRLLSGRGNLAPGVRDTGVHRQARQAMWLTVRDPERRDWPECGQGVRAPPASRAGCRQPPECAAKRRDRRQTAFA